MASLGAFLRLLEANRLPVSPAPAAEMPPGYYPTQPEPMPADPGMIDRWRSPYEPTLGPGEIPTTPEIQDRLLAIIEAAGMASVPGVGPHPLETSVPGARRPPSVTLGALMDALPFYGRVKEEARTREEARFANRLRKGLQAEEEAIKARDLAPIKTAQPMSEAEYQAWLKRADSFWHKPR